MKRAKVDHEHVDRVDNYLQGKTEFEWQEYMEFLDWTCNVYSAERDLGYLAGSSVGFFKKVLGKQTTTINLSYRNWVWVGEGYVVYVDKRGFALHVPMRRGLLSGEFLPPTFGQAYEAYKNFRRDVEDGLDALLPPTGS